MKLISWNCQGAFRKKSSVILAEQPDILVIQECEHPDKFLFSATTPSPTDVMWFGDNHHKGLGIFSYSNYRFQLLEWHNPDFKIVTPIRVTGGPFDFTLIAIWANNRNDPDGQYIEQVWKAIHFYEQVLDIGRVILIGDFNSNTIWDRPRRVGNHSAVVRKLADKNIYSLYHGIYRQEQGKEDHPTFYLHRNQSKQYHLDYCFSSADLYREVRHITLGTYDAWRMHSDHVPILVDFDF